MLFKDFVSQRKILIGLNALLGSCFFFYHVLLDQHYCLSADDFSGIDYSSRGIPGLTYAWHFYRNWEGPFLTHLIHGFIMWLVAVGIPPWIAFVVVKVSMVGSCAVLIRALSWRFNLNLERVEAVFLGLIFILVLYLISPQPTQIWHWLTGMVYLYPLVFLMFGLAAILRGKLFLAIIPLAVVMQSRATYSVLIFGFTALLCLASVVRKWESRKQWLILGAGLLFFLVVYLAAPGNYVRMTEHGNSVSFMASQFKVGLHNLLVSYNLAKVDRILLGFLAAFPALAGASQLPKPKKTWAWVAPMALYLGFAVTHEFLFVMVTGYCEWTRVLSLHSFLFMAMASVYGFWLYSMIPGRIRVKLRPLSVLGAAGLCIRLFSGFEGQLYNAEQLKENYDRRMNTIQSYVGRDTLLVEPINYNGVLYFEDFSEDPDNWINKDFRKAYDLEFKVALKKNGTAE